MRGTFTQVSIATSYGQSQLVLQLVKVGKFPLHIREVFFQSATHRRTRLQPIPSQPQKRSNLTEFESQALYTANKSECLHVALGVLTESPLCPGWSWKQCIAFVESNRVNAKTDFFRYDANLHTRC